MIEAALLFQMIAKFLPDGIAIFQDIKDLFKKYPGITPEQFAALVTAVANTADITYDQVIADIKKDQAAHPPK